MCHGALKAVGGAMGAGIVVMLPDSSCGLAETARVIRYLADENAGQCGPCLGVSRAPLLPVPGEADWDWA
jgi:NADH:ubiquinone oxidoreductase subunit F (NADH-binding)